MPFNTSGNPNTSNLSIPRACVKIALLDENDNPGPWRDVGDVSSAQISFDTTEAEHYTSCGEQRVRDSRIAVETNVDLSMQFDHILDTANLELIYAADAIDQAAPLQIDSMVGALIVPNPDYSGTDQLEDTTFAGRSFKLWIDDDTPDYVYAGVMSPWQTVDAAAGGATARLWRPSKHIFQVNSAGLAVVGEIGGPVNDASGGGTAYTVASGDITVNSNQGTIFIVEGSALATAMGNVGSTNTDAKYIVMQLTYDGAAATAPAFRPVVQGLASASRAIAVRLEQQDSNRPGFRAVVEIFKTRLIPSGEVDLISDGTDFSTASLEGSVEKPAWMDDSEGLSGFFHKYDVAF